MEKSEQSDKIDKLIAEKTETKTKRTAMDMSPELTMVKDNLEFIQKMAQKPIKKGVHRVKVFGCKMVDPLSVVCGDNIWNRSIFTVDSLCDGYDSATLQQRLKYQKKPRRMNSNLGFIIVLVIGAIIAIFVLFMLLGVFG